MLTLSNPDILGLGPPDRDRSSSPPEPFIHSAAIADGAQLGSGTRVWAFAHVLPGAVLGKDCNVCDHTFIEGDVRIGDRVTIKSGVYIWDGSILEDDVFIGPCVVFTNDRRPRSKRYPGRFEGVTVRRGASIGAGAVLLPGIEIGEYAMVGAGAVVTQSVPAQALVYGNPARRHGTVCRCGQRLDQNENGACCSVCETNSVVSGKAA